MTGTAPSILLSAKRFLVIDKPAGLAVHPGPQTPDSLESLLPLLAPPNRPAPAPVHRLDRDTSGCLLLARDRSALRQLAAAFADGRVRKTYHAIIEHPPASDTGRINAPLAKRSSSAEGWRMVPDPAGKPAATDWAILARHAHLALIRFQPRTGRTHQLRVHATLLGAGAAIVGDPIYGRAHPAGMMLHATSLTFPDPWSEPPDTKTARAPCPSRFNFMGFAF